MPSSLVLFDGVLQTFTRLEFWLLGLWNLDFFLRLWIAAHTGLARRDAEGAEADKPDLAATAQLAFDGIEDTFHRLRCVGFAKTGGCRDGGD